MIKKLIGIIVAVAVVVIIVVAAIRRDNFQSMVRRDELLNVPAKDAPAAGTVDSLSVEITDSLP